MEITFKIITQSKLQTFGWVGTLLYIALLLFEKNFVESVRYTGIYKVDYSAYCVPGSRGNMYQTNVTTHIT